MSTRLVVVAHRTGARFLTQDAKGELSLVEEIEHPEGRERNIDHDTDRPGRTHDSGGTRHSLERHESAHETGAHAFARLVAHRINDLRVQHRYDTAVLVAEPDFLGLLRGSLDPTTAKTVTGSVGKDLAQVETRALAKELEGKL